MDDMRFAKGTDFGCHGLFLLEQHAPGFEVANPGYHGALHDGATFVIFDIAHPARFFECNFFGEALFLEVADGVIVSVREKMLNGGGRFDIIFQMGH